MKILIAAAGLLALASSAQAQETRTEERRVMVLGGGHAMEIGEEGLTRDAFLARHAEMFARLDADSNGVVTREEMAAMAERHGGGQAEWSGEDGPRRFVLRRDGQEGGERQVVIVRQGGDGETVDVQGGPEGHPRIEIRRRGPDGETITIEGGEGEWIGDDSEHRIVIRDHGPGDDHAAMSHGDGERHVMVFRHSAEGGLDTDGDGRWSFEEMVAPMREHFNRLDANGDGFVDEAERRH